MRASLPLSSPKIEGGGPMKLPADVLAAKDRMGKADAALRADIESISPVDKIRCVELIEELQLAMDDYIERISRLRS
jgi:hypothetical protein